MKKIFLIITVACLFLVSGCYIVSGSRNIHYDKILFGKGGGFTGKYDEYFLGKNGNIYKKDPATRSFTKIKSLSVKQTKSIFKEIDENELFELGFNVPYNMSSYIEIVKDSVSNRIVWGNSKHPPPESVTAIFDKLMGMIPTPNSDNKFKGQKN